MPEESLQRQLVVFSLGEEEYALPITQVHEIIRYTEPRSVASTDPSVRGVISLRGKILPVYDLATRLGVEHAEISEAKIVIVETAQDMAGVIVDDVEEVITIDAEQIGEAPSAGIGPNHPINGIAKIDDRLVVLLDPERIVDGAGGSDSGSDSNAAGGSDSADELRTAA